MRGLAPVIRVAHERDPVALHPFLEGEGPGAHRGCLMSSMLSGATITASPQAMLNRKLPSARLSVTFTVSGSTTSTDSMPRTALLGVGAVLGAGPVERELDILGVHRAAVVEGHAVLQVKGIGHARHPKCPSSAASPGLDRPVGRTASAPRRRWHRVTWSMAPAAAPVGSRCGGSSCMADHQFTAGLRGWPDSRHRQARRAAALAAP